MSLKGVLSKKGFARLDIVQFINLTIYLDSQ